MRTLQREGNNGYPYPSVHLLWECFIAIGLVVKNGLDAQDYVGERTYLMGNLGSLWIDIACLD